MAKSVSDLVASMNASANNVRFSDACKVAEHYFGPPRQDGTSHKVYKTPWRGDPRINLQSIKGKAKPYQVKQLLAAIEKLESMKKDEKEKKEKKGKKARGSKNG